MWSLREFLLHAASSLPSTGVLLSTAALGLLLVLRLGSFRRDRALKALPRPASTLPVLGNTLDVLKKQRARLHDWLADECKRHAGKPWVFHTIGRAPAIVLSTEALFEDVLKTQFHIFEKGPQASELARDFFGEGIFAVDGAKWLHQRKTASHLFSHHMMRDIMDKAIADDTTVLCEILDNARRDGTRLEIKLLMDALTTDVFTRIGFGVRLGCLRGGEGVGAEFHQAFSRCPKAIQLRTQQPTWLWKLKRRLHIGVEGQFTDDMKLVNDAIYNVIEASMQRATECVAGETNLISLFLSRPKMDNDVETSPQLIRDMALSFIAAGRGTTGQSLAWFFVMMNRYPDVQRKIRRELLDELPELMNGSKTVPSMDDVQRLTYLEATIKESLRLNPSAPNNGRTANADTTLCDGTFVPRGVRVMIPTYATARLPWLWGEDAAEFKPERWIDPETGKLLHISPFKFLVFHAGPRMCLGVKLTLLEMKIAIAAVMSKFVIETERDPFDITYDLSLSLPIKGDFFAHVRAVPSIEKHAVAPTAPTPATAG